MKRPLWAEKKESTVTTVDSFGSKGVLDVDGAEYEIFRLNKVEGSEKLPFSLKILLGEPAPYRRRREHHQGANPGPGQLGSFRSAQHRNSVHSGSRLDAGLHWCSLCC